MTILAFAIWILFSFALGTIFGSFYNVLIFRVPEDRSFIKGRSCCMTCGHRLEWKDLCPLISYIVLKGKCRYCKTTITPRYSMVEAAAGVFGVIAFMIGGVSLRTLYLFSFWSMLLVVAVIDYDRCIIIDSVWIIFTVINFAAILAENPNAWASPVFGAITGYVFYGLVYVISKHYYKQEAFGDGDVMLLAASGVVLGPFMTVVTGFLAFIVAGIWLLLMRLKKSEINGDMRIPFGPYVAVAGFITSIAAGSYDTMNPPLFISVFKSLF